ncbi:hypothetical protein O988_02319 [Pseudogymnoascus sp. VKM F-3808]|nr:hypothetical protein O988_02319 [Pseudogymnoascus sp. VKM F-3808]
MKLIKLAFFAIPFFTAVSAVAVAEPEPVTFEAKVKKDADAASSVEVRREFAEEGNLQKRACTNNGCTCASGSAQGQYCGYCNQVTGKGSAALWGENSFECNPSGGCCFYGYTSQCAGSNWSAWCPR